MGDDSDGDQACLRYGTPLDPYDEDEVPKKKSAFQDITEQYAYDSNGKRRFHGAFTGGFSAGHWNTVGLPEGFNPQTFKSSRSNRMQLDQKPEDFMDDEDRSEFGIAPKEVQTTKDFSGSKRPKNKTFHEGPIPGIPVLQNILEPVHETAAIRILKSMGWRPGKGIGEQITRRQKKSNKKLYTCYVPEEFRKGLTNQQDDNSESSEDEEEYSELLFEPDDFEPFVIKPKDNTFGLGYTGLSRHSVLGKYHNDKNEDWQGSHLLMNDKGRKVSIRGQAFGVGALEEEDEDIYSREDLSGYDFALDNIPTAEKHKKENEQLKKSSFRTILDGFVASSVEYKLAKTFPPPALPPNYVPRYTKVKKSRFSDAEEGSNVAIRDRGLGRHDLSFKDRGNILGERDNVPKVPEVIQPQSLEDKLVSITNRSINFVSDSNKTPVELNKEVADTNKAVEEFCKESKPTGVFRPFLSNPAKQSRYEQFILNKEGNKSDADGNSKEKTDRISEWERVRELHEFEQAYKLYKPLSGTMGEKFVSALHDENSPLEITKSSIFYASKEKIEAARLGKFGALTREINQWCPDSLLCKRFNIAEPFHGGYAQQNVEKKTKSYSIFDYLETSIHNKDSYLKEQIKQDMKSAEIRSIKELEKSKIDTQPNKEIVEVVPKIDDCTKSQVAKKRLTVAELFLKEKEKEATNSIDINVDNDISSKESNEAEEDTVQDTISNFNKIDLYKAVFLSDSDSNESESEELKSKDIEKEKQDVDVKMKNIQRNESPPKGIFANLNFDKMNSWRMNRVDNRLKEDKDKVPDKIVIKDKEVVKSKDQSKSSEDIEEIYGPRLPEVLSKNKDTASNDVMEVDSSSDSSDWVETDKVKSKKSKHKKSKKSSKKKKKNRSPKHKHKKHKI